MRLNSRWFAILLALGPSHGAEPNAGEASPSKVELRGIFSAGDAYMFILTDAEGNSSNWLKVNQQAFGFTIVSFSAAGETVTLENGADKRRIVVPLSKGAVIGQAALSSGPKTAPESTSAPELPPEVRAAMFPAPGAAHAPMLSHPRDAAPNGASSGKLSADTARYFPATPGPKWNHPGDIPK
jgi:hypothetical protein